MLEGFASGSLVDGSFLESPVFLTTSQEDSEVYQYDDMALTYYLVKRMIRIRIKITAIEAINTFATNFRVLNTTRTINNKIMNVKRVGRAPEDFLVKFLNPCL